MAEGATTVGLREAAEQLGVHYMTAYRYVRSGRLPARKRGSEWQVDPADLARLAAAPTHRAPRRPTRAVHRERLEARLVEGDEGGAWGVVDAAMASGAEPAEVLTELLATWPDDASDAVRSLVQQVESIRDALGELNEHARANLMAGLNHPAVGTEARGQLSALDGRLAAAQAEQPLTKDWVNNWNRKAQVTH